MTLNKRDGDKIYEVIVKEEFDPAEFSFDDTGKKVIIGHSSGSTFTFRKKLEITGGHNQYGIAISHHIHNFTAGVVDGVNETDSATDIDFLITVSIPRWLKEIRLTVGVAYCWAELQASRQSIAVIQQENFGNTSFSEDEQRQISAQLQDLKNQLTEHFELTGEQMAHVVERLDKLEEESYHLGRKDWLIIFITTISPLVVGDVLTPGVARHIFTIVINGLIHLFGGGPQQILS